MGIQPVKLLEHSDICDVCHVSIPDLAEALTSEQEDRVLSFCSQDCYKKYIEDPTVYTDFEDEEPSDQ